MNINKYKNIFLDRDGVINKIVMRNEIVGSPRNLDEFVFKKDFLDFASKFSNKFNFFIVTNQPDINRGLMSIKDLKKIHEELKKVLEIKEIKFCPHDNKDNCICRKPLPGMIEELVFKYHLKKDQCLMIGDSKKDITAAIKANISACYINTHYNDPEYRVKNIKSLTELNYGESK